MIAQAPANYARRQGGPRSHCWLQPFVPTRLMNLRRRTAASKVRATFNRRGFSPEKQVDATDEYPDLKATGRFAF